MNQADGIAVVRPSALPGRLTWRRSDARLFPHPLPARHRRPGAARLRVAAAEGPMEAANRAGPYVGFATCRAHRPPVARRQRALRGDILLTRTKRRKGAAVVRCRASDGRAAILGVVHRPRGCHGSEPSSFLSASPRTSSGRRRTAGHASQIAHSRSLSSRAKPEEASVASGRRVPARAPFRRIVMGVTCSACSGGCAHVPNAVKRALREERCPIDSRSFSGSSAPPSRRCC